MVVLCRCVKKANSTPNFLERPNESVWQGVFMNCKFHPAAEAVTTCASCGAGMCASCENGAFFRVESGQPLCFECSLKKAGEDVDFGKSWLKKEEDDLAREKKAFKTKCIKGIIAVIFWGAGIYLFKELGGGAVFVMLVAAIFYLGTAVFYGEADGCFDKIKSVFQMIIFGTLVLPWVVISEAFRDRREIKKIEAKVNKIKAALGNAN